MYLTDGSAGFVLPVDFLMRHYGGALTAMGLHVVLLGIEFE